MEEQCGPIDGRVSYSIPIVSTLVNVDTTNLGETLLRHPRPPCHRENNTSHEACSRFALDEVVLLAWG